MSTKEFAQLGHRFEPLKDTNWEACRCGAAQPVGFAGHRRDETSILTIPCPFKTAVRISEALESMLYQFSYPCTKDGQPALCTGGLSVLEDAFNVMGWDDPYLIPDPGCLQTQDASMSEFPEWVERSIGLAAITYEHAERIHKALRQGRLPDPRIRSPWWYWRCWWPFDRRKA